MTAVWDHAAVSGGDLLVLLAMADFAHDDGSGVYPLQSTLAAKARMTERNLRYCLEALETAGYIERQGKRGTRISWRVDPNPANIATRQPASGQSGNGLPTEPSVKSSVEKDSLRSSPTSDTAANGDPSPPVAAAPPPRRVEKPQSDRQDVDALCMLLAALMRERDPKVKIPDTETKWRRWQDAARLLIDADERHFEEVEQVLRFSQADEFWKTNILSMPTFREKYDKLRAKWIGSRQRAQAAVATSQQPTTADLMAAYERRDAAGGTDERRRRAGVR
jgi:hypothetical protein